MSHLTIIKTMKIKSFEEILAASDKVCANAIESSDKKAASIFLEVGKFAHALVVRHPDQSLNESFRAAGGKGKVPDMATMTRNVFAGLVHDGGPLEESAYDDCKISHFKPVSPALNALAKFHKLFDASRIGEWKTEMAGILTRKPDDAMKLLRAIREEIEIACGIREKKAPAATPPAAGPDDEEVGEDPGVHLTAFDLLDAALERYLPLIPVDDIPLAHEMIVEHVRALIARHDAATGETPAAPALPESATAVAVAA